MYVPGINYRREVRSHGTFDVSGPGRVARAEAAANQAHAANAAKAATQGAALDSQKAYNNLQLKHLHQNTALAAKGIKLNNNLAIIGGLANLANTALNIALPYAQQDYDNKSTTAQNIYNEHFNKVQRMVDNEPYRVEEAGPEHGNIKKMVSNAPIIDQAIAKGDKEARELALAEVDDNDLMEELNLHWDTNMVKTHDKYTQTKIDWNKQESANQYTKNVNGLLEAKEYVKARESTERAFLTGTIDGPSYFTNLDLIDNKEIGNGHDQAVMDILGESDDERALATIEERIEITTELANNNKLPVDEANQSIGQLRTIKNQILRAQAVNVTLREQTATKRTKQIKEHYKNRIQDFNTSNMSSVEMLAQEKAILKEIVKYPIGLQADIKSMLETRIDKRTSAEKTIRSEAETASNKLDTKLQDGFQLELTEMDHLAPGQLEGKIDDLLGRVNNTRLSDKARRTVIEDVQATIKSAGDREQARGKEEKRSQTELMKMAEDNLLLRVQTWEHLSPSDQQEQKASLAAEIDLLADPNKRAVLKSIEERINDGLSREKKREATATEFAVSQSVNLQLQIQNIAYETPEVQRDYLNAAKKLAANLPDEQQLALLKVIEARFEKGLKQDKTTEADFLKQEKKYADKQKLFIATKLGETPAEQQANAISIVKSMGGMDAGVQLEIWNALTKKMGDSAAAQVKLDKEVAESIKVAREQYVNGIGDATLRWATMEVASVIDSAVHITGSANYSNLPYDEKITVNKRIATGLTGNLVGVMDNLASIDMDMDSLPKVIDWVESYSFTDLGLADGKAKVDLIGKLDAVLKSHGDYYEAQLTKQLTTEAMVGIESGTWVNEDVTKTDLAGKKQTQTAADALNLYWSKSKKTVLDGSNTANVAQNFINVGEIAPDALKDMEIALKSGLPNDMGAAAEFFQNLAGTPDQNGAAMGNILYQEAFAKLDKPAQESLLLMGQLPAEPNARAAMMEEFAKYQQQTTPLTSIQMESRRGAVKTLTGDSDYVTQEIKKQLAARYSQEAADNFGTTINDIELLENVKASANLMAGKYFNSASDFQRGLDMAFQQYAISDRAGRPASSNTGMEQHFGGVPNAALTDFYNQSLETANINPDVMGDYEEVQTDTSEDGHPVYKFLHKVTGETLKIQKSEALLTGAYADPNDPLADMYGEDFAMELDPVKFPVNIEAEKAQKMSALKSQQAGWKSAWEFIAANPQERVGSNYTALPHRPKGAIFRTSTMAQDQQIEGSVDKLLPFSALGTEPSEDAIPAQLTNEAETYITSTLNLWFDTYLETNEEEAQNPAITKMRYDAIEGALYNMRRNPDWYDLAAKDWRVFQDPVQF